MANTDLSVIILAAGKGTRMKSNLPKTLHKVTSYTMLDLVINNAKSLNANNVCAVVSDEMDEYRKKIINNHPEIDIEFIVQKDRLGTGHAVKIALENMNKVGNKVIVLYGDTPLIKSKTLQNMERTLENNSLCVLSFDCEDENKYGRLVTIGEELEKIVEFKDASTEERKIKLCNSGVVAIKDHNILGLINEIDNNNASKEYYLTDIVEIVKNKSLQATYLKCDENEVLGVNSRVELARVEELKQNELRNKFMADGVTMIDPKTVYFAADTIIENDVIIHPSVVFGKNVVVKTGVEIKSFSHIEDAVIANGAAIGPFARIRPGSRIGENAKIGNFVEIKKSEISKDAKIGHLTYIGDSEIGGNVNIGAGTITCNYDGYNKFKTVIEENSFIGSNTALIAPVKIGKNSVVGAGSVISKEVKENDIAVCRAKQTNIKDGAIQYHENKKK